MINQDFFNDLFLEYFSGIDPSDTNTIEQCRDDFIDECKEGAERLAQKYLEERLYPNGYNWSCEDLNDMIEKGNNFLNN